MSAYDPKRTSEGKQPIEPAAIVTTFGRLAVVSHRCPAWGYLGLVSLLGLGAGGWQGDDPIQPMQAHMKLHWAVVMILLAGALISGPSFAASCQNTGSFARWLDGFKQEALAQGISRKTISVALRGVRFDRKVIALDRRQFVFSQSFLQFSDRMVAKYRLQQGAKLLKKYRTTFERIEQQFGVPAPVIVAFWGLESDFGANIGNLPTLRSLATLAYDCRRPDEFRPQLMDALRIIEVGDLRPDEMRGPWAGELGQTQLLPSAYFKFAIDYDGNGKRDLLRSTADVLASTANYLSGMGWRRGEPWLQEVRVPAQLPWDQADLEIQHPLAQWSRWGVRTADGGALPTDNLPASLLLPMGRYGPAFLAYPNFWMFLEWNQSLVYSTTAAYFAARLAGAPPLRRGTVGKAGLGFAQIKQLQRLLVQRRYDVGEVDGILGKKSRAAVKAVQIRLGLPADSYPSPALLNGLRRLR
jgi:lytic murein transglycosylase